MTGPSDGGSSVAFSPDGQMALLGDDNGAIRLWDIQPSPDPRTFSGHTHVVATTKLSPAGGPPLVLGAPWPAWWTWLSRISGPC